MENSINKYKKENIKGKSYYSIKYNIETHHHLTKCFHQQSGSSIYQQYTAQQIAMLFTYLIVK